MRFALFTLAYLLCVFQCVLVNAFTVGKLLPSYICGPTLPDNGLQTTIAQDGLPKSLSDWLKYIGDNVNGNTQIGRMTNRFITGQTGAVIDPAVRVDFATDAGTVNNTKYLLTNWHNRDQFTGCKKTIFVTTALTNHPNIVNQIVPGQNHSLQLTINGQNGNPLCDFYANQNMVTADDIANIALDGAVVYGITNGGTRVGTFVALGANAAGDTTVEPWAACGSNNIGIVHNQLISETGQYPGVVGTPAPLIWQAPATLVPNTAAAASQVFFQGAAVTDVGFGKHVSMWNVASPKDLAAAGITLNVAQPIITKVAEMGKNLAVFFNSQAKGAPAATNAVVIPTTFVAKAAIGGTVVAQATVKQAQAQVALIPLTKAMKGQTLAITVTASNNAGGLPTTSGTFTFALPGGNVQNVINLDVVLQLCPADQQKERVMFLQDTDPDYQCAFQTQTLLDNGTVAIIQETVVAGAAQQSPAIALITLFAVAVAAMARKI